MDEATLAGKGISPGSIHIGYVEEFALRIGERATLVRSAGARAYGVVMDISADDVKALYAESSVVDYVPEPVTVMLVDESKVAAICYNLPVDKVTGTNRAYAEALMALAKRLGLPEYYLAEIKRASG